MLQLGQQSELGIVSLQLHWKPIFCLPSSSCMYIVFSWLFVMHMGYNYVLEVMQQAGVTLPSSKSLPIASKMHLHP